MENTDQTFKSPIKNLNDLEFFSKNIKEDTVFNITDAYWELRFQRKLLQKSIGEHENGEDKVLLQYLENQMLNLEAGFKVSIKTYCQEFEVGRWALSQYGVGPLTVARLLRYIDVTKARTHEQLWAYAGLAPKSGPAQTYNSSLKDTCVDLGRLFIRYAEKDECYYGQLFKTELARRIELNDKGMYADLLRDESQLSHKNSSQNVSTKLSLDRLRAQAQRYAVKIFLVHWYSTEYKHTYGQEYITNNKNIIPVPGN